MTAKNKNKKQAKKSFYTQSRHGILLLDKPSGITSNKALQTARYALRAKKAGHTGSLDPLASGLLPLCFGEATKISSYLLEADKTYEVTAVLGVKTDSADSDGEITERQVVPDLSLQQITSVLESFLGSSQQVPPMYSALKQNGVRLYKLAREGQVVERKPRDIHISVLELLEYDKNTISLRATVSKGTYIRSLVEDIAKALGTLAHVSILRRTGVAPYSNPDMCSLENFIELPEAEQLQHLMPITSALAHWESVQLDERQSADLKQGKTVQMSGYTAQDLVLVLTPKGQALAIGSIDVQGILKTRRLFLLDA